MNDTKTTNILLLIIVILRRTMPTGEVVSVYNMLIDQFRILWVSHHLILSLTIAIFLNYYPNTGSYIWFLLNSYPSWVNWELLCKLTLSIYKYLYYIFLIITLGILGTFQINTIGMLWITLIKSYFTSTWIFSRINTIIIS